MSISRLLVLFIASLYSTLSFAQVDTVLNRYERFLLKTGNDTSGAALWVRTLNDQSQWNDVKYNDTERANWKASDHLKRIKALALVWSNPASKLYHDAQWKAVIERALQHWIDKRYKNSNWWHNEIGVPRYMRDILVLLRGQLNASQWKGAMEVLDQYKIHPSTTGANLVWTADLGLHYGALANDLARMDSCSRLISKEIVITDKDGVQPDYSFHQHDKRLQMYQYGAAFLQEGVRIAWELQQTKWALPKSKIDIFADFVLKGWQWTARGINTVPGTIDRSASRVGSLHAADLRSLIPYLCELSPEHTKAFLFMQQCQNDKAALEGFRYFPYSDFTAYQQKHFTFFLKTLSNRTLPTESINSENLKGKLLHSGDGYFIRNGNEYFNLMPVWEWRSLPGVTTFDSANNISRKSFCGSVSDEQSGLSAMDYVMADKTGERSVSAKKIWVCDGDMVVCLIAGLETKNNAGPIYTAMDQCRLQGDVYTGPGSKLKEGAVVFKSKAYLYHNKFLYLPLDSSSMAVVADTVSGTWNSINASQPTAIVHDKVFMPALYQSTGVATGYAVVYAENIQQADKIAHQPTWTILRNDSLCQAVSFANGKAMAAFFSPVALVLKDKQTLKVDKPCLIMIANNTLYASDPTNRGGEVNVVYNGIARKVVLPANGFTVKEQW